jgi:methionyl-tRNA synthetase
LDKYLVTSGLPYANGDLHIGHVAGAYLPADIFVRFLRLKQQDVIYICGTDEHGAPISIKAEQEGVSSKELVERYHQKIKTAFDGIGIEFDNFSGTARPEHHKLAQEFFLNLMEAGYINERKSEQFFDEEKQRFLPDRYVEGICPHCGSEGARGDQCDSCGKLIDAMTLKNPISKISGKTPIVKETIHWYLNLPAFSDELKKWLETRKNWKENVHNFIMSWLKEGLIERAITRDINWGIPVPLEEAKGKVLYVWFDAPIGYISSTVEWAKNIGKPDKWKDYWLNPDCKLIHFIGKDNIPFHTIIWPAMLMKQKLAYVLPHDVPANEYLNIKGQKTSTSKNYAIWVKDFLQYFDGELLRYVLAANAPETKDSDFSWEDFQQKINNDLANTLGNLANRVFTFAKKYFDGRIQRNKILSNYSTEILEKCLAISQKIEENYSAYQVRQAVKNCMDIARLGNKYFDETKPWVAIKENREEAEETLFVCCEMLRKITILLAPVLPKSMKSLRTMLGIQAEVLWDDIFQETQEFQIGESKPLFRKISDEEIAKQNALFAKPNQIKKIEHKDTIEYDDFAKLELRIAEIVSAEKIKKSKKLLKVEVELGGEKRTVVAGISQFYSPEKLIGKKVVMLVNLQPRKVMGVKSEGMILAAADDDALSILTSEKDVQNGSIIS